MEALLQRARRRQLSCERSPAPSPCLLSLRLTNTHAELCGAVEDVALHALASIVPFLAPRDLAALRDVSSAFRHAPALLSAVTSVSANEQPETEVEISYLQRFTSLASLTLLEPESLAELSQLRTLPFLRSVSICDMDLCDLYPLRALPMLCELTLSCVESYANLHRLTALTRLAFCDTVASAALESLSNLRSLELSDGESVCCLTALTQLSQLHLSSESDSEDSPATFQLLSCLSSLRVLELSSAYQIQGVSLPVLASTLTRLRCLSMVELTSGLQSVLPSLSRLQSLGLTWCGCSVHAHTAVVASPSLTCLRLECCCADDPAFVPDMRALPSLSLLQLELREGEYQLSARVLPAHCVRVEALEPDTRGELFLKTDCLTRIQFSAVTSLGSLN